MRELSLFVWNARGAGSAAFLTSMFDYITQHKPSIVVLLETHISGTRADTVCRKLGFQGCFRVEAQGFSGGIWLLWDVAISASFD